MIPQQGGSSDFLLTSAHGSVQSKSNLGNNRAGVQIYPGLGVQWGYFSGSLDGNSIAAKYNVQAADFRFTTNKTYKSVYNSAGNSKSYTSTSVEQHIKWLYSLVNSAYSRANSAYSRANSAYSRANSAYNRASDGIDRANSAYNLADTKVSKSTFNDHTHQTVVTSTRYSRYELSTGGRYTDIDGLGNGGGKLVTEVRILGPK